MIKEKLTGVMMVILLAALFACSEKEEAEEGEAVLVTPGKADNFFSPNAQEYFVEGESTVVLESEYADRPEEEKLERVRELIGYKKIVIGWFMGVYIADKGHDAENKGYGGFHSLVRNGSFEDLQVQTDQDNDLKYYFNFIGEIGGPLNLLSLIPTVHDIPDPGPGKKILRLKYPVISNAEISKLDFDNEWYRSSKYGSGTFNPDTWDGELEVADLLVYPEERSLDGYIDMQSLLADGRITVGIHIGWDYYDARYDLQNAKAAYESLIDRGFVSPVDSYEDYKADSGPLTATINTPMGDIQAEVVIVHPGQGDPGGRDFAQQMKDAMLESFRSREIIVYEGHSGNYYAFALANWRQVPAQYGEVDDSELPLIDMGNFYQIVIADGCDTYALGEAFFLNPAKADRKTLDVVTTTNFSNAGAGDIHIREVYNIMFGKDIATGPEGTSYNKMLKSFNPLWGHFGMYGVHGVDNNPHVHPFGIIENLCKPCESDGECGNVLGSGYGNQCTRLSETEKVCTVECLADDGCPKDYVCMDVGNSGNYHIYTKQCVPAGYTCNFTPAPDETPVLVINEILADPPPDLLGDANGDGVRDARQDEFIEIINSDTGDVDMSGFSIADGVKVRFTFPDGTVLPAGKAIVVFGGGEIGQFTTDFGGTPVLTSDGLYLNNTGDTVTLQDLDAKVIDQVSFSISEIRDRAIVRETEGNPDSQMIPYNGTPPYTPGRTQTGEEF